MDSRIEAVFIQKLQAHKDVVTSKCRNKELDQAKETAWNTVRTELFAETGKNFSVEYLKQRWGNMVDRVKGKVAKRGQTGSAGGKEAQFSENDNMIIELIGKDNPKLAKIPNAMDSFRMGFMKENKGIGMDLEPEELEPDLLSTPCFPGSASSTSLVTERKGSFHELRAKAKGVVKEAVQGIDQRVLQIEERKLALKEEQLQLQRTMAELCRQQLSELQLIRQAIQQSAPTLLQQLEGAHSQLPPTTSVVQGEGTLGPMLPSAGAGQLGGALQWSQMAQQFPSATQTNAGLYTPYSL